MDVWTLCWRNDQVERERELLGFHYNAKARRFFFAEGTRALFCWYTRDWLASEPCATQQLVAWLPATGCMELQVGRRSTSSSQPCDVSCGTNTRKSTKKRAKFRLSEVVLLHVFMLTWMLGAHFVRIRKQFSFISIPVLLGLNSLTWTVPKLKCVS